MDAAMLQKLREESGLRLDAEGRFSHRGEPVEHARTLAVLLKNLHRAEDGRWATSIGPEWGYVDVEDAALFIRRVDAANLRAQLASGEWAPFDPRTLAIGASDSLYLRIHGERARLTRPAQLELAEVLDEQDGAYFVTLGGQRVPVLRDTGPEPVRRP